MTGDKHQTNLPQANQFFSNAKIGTKLGWGFGILIFLAVTLGVADFISTRLEDAALEKLLSAEEEANQADQIRLEALQARRNEEDFLLFHKSEGFDSAYENYVVANQQNTQAILDLLAEAKLEEQPEEHLSILDSIETATRNYQTSFGNTVEQIRERGFKDEGLEGRFREDIHQLEETPVIETHPELLAFLLQMRRHEKNWILRQEMADVELVKSFAARLKDGIRALDITNSEKVEQIKLIDDYLDSFDRLVAIDLQIAEQSGEFHTAIVSINSLAEQIFVQKQAEAADALAELRQIKNGTLILSSYLHIMSIILGIGLAVFLTRNISGPIMHLAAVANQVARGDLTARALIATRDEIGGLADNFNQMTAQLRETLEGLEQTVARRTQALEISANVSRRLSTILDEKQLVSEVVEQVRSAFDYYYAHIYIFDESGEKLVMAGGTGEAGQTMLARGHTIDKGKGLVGRAAETNTAVLVQDVAEEEGWLPNPLLPDTKAEVAVPIALGDEVLGVLDVQHSVAGSLTQAQADLIQGIANQVAIALRNARAYTRTQRQVEREVLVNTITQKIQSSTTVDSAMQIAVRELGRALGRGRTQVRLKVAQSENGQVKGGG